MIVFRRISVSKFLLLLFGIFFGYTLFSVVLLETGISTDFIYIVQILFYVVLFFAYYVRGLTRYEQKAILSYDKKSFSFLLMAAPFFIGSLINLLYVLFIENFFPVLFESYQEASNSAGQLMDQAGGFQMILLFIAIVILAPIVEEIVFRGVFFNLLAGKKSTLFAMIISSLLFGVLHADTMVPTAVIGFILCFIYHKTGNLYLSMAAHGFNNLIAFVMPTLLQNTSEVSPTAIFLSSALILVNIVVTIVFIRFLARNWKWIKEVAPFFRTNEEVKIKEGDPQMTPPQIIDITKHLTHGMPVYPGDPEVLIEEKNRIATDGFSLRKLSFSTHSGTHLDFPAHFVEDGKNADDIDLARYFGEASVVRSFEEPVPDGVKIVLSKSGYLSGEQAERFIRDGILLIGTVHESIEQDYPYPLHKILLGNDIIILENLELNHVSEGQYRLVVLPMKIEGAEASPCRAVLLK